MRRILLATLTLLLACLTTVAWADWAAGATGLAGARLSVVPTPGAPTAEATADDVAVTWPAAEVSGYVVERTQQETGTTQQACGGVVAAASCLDTGVPAGTWTYRVRARMGSWQGQPSPASAAVVVVAPVAATLDISSRVAVPGDDLTVTGSGWPADAAVTVEVGGATLCSAIGSFTKTCALPDLAAGTYPLRAKAGTTVVTSGTLQVVPGLRAVTPLTSPGGQISARGRGFAGASRVEVRLGEVLLHQTTTTQTGETNTMQVTVPANTPAGAYTLRVVDSAGNEASAPVTVAAAGLAVTPSSATPGDRLQVGGVGWPAGASVSVRIRTSPLCTLTADSFGAISGACTLPDTAGGDTSISATNGSSTAASPFRVLASVAPTSTAATSPGGTLQLKVRGFGASSPLRYQFDDGPVATTPLTTPEAGTLTFDVTVPQLESGQHTVWVTDAAGSSASTTVRVVAPELSLSQTSGVVQSSFSVSGQNWPANVGVSIKFDGTAFNCTPLTRADGSFGPTPCTVPMMAGGPHAISAASTTAVLGTPLTFTITPKVTVTPVMATPGQPISFTGTGLPANSTAGLVVGGQTVASVTTTGSGQASSSTVLPDLPAGVTPVKIVGGLGASPETTITVFRPTVQLSTSTLVPNQPLRVTGTGWPAGYYVSIRVGTAIICTPQAIGGNLDASCTPQSVAGGAGQVVVAYAQQIPSVTASWAETVTVVPTATFDSGTVAAGQTARVTARGLLAGRTVELYVGGVLVESRPGPSDGTWARSYTVPAGTPAGPLEFEFRQQDVPPVRVTLTVTG